MRVYKFTRKTKSGRKWYYLKWFDGTEWHRESTGCTRATEAERVRANKESSLARSRQITTTGWDPFIERYVREVLGGSSKANQAKFMSSAHKFAEICAPELISDVDTEMVAKFVQELRGKLAAATLFSYLNYLERALEWAAKPQIGLLDMPPVINKPDLPTDPARGRPITLEEFERIKMQSARVVGRNAATSFIRLMDGLWLSGMRLAEILNIYWNRERVDQIVVIESPASVRLEIPARAQKRRRYQLWRPAEEFQQWLRNVHPECRKGPVFSPVRNDGKRHTRVDTVSKRISEMGKLAGVVVEYDEDGPIKYASAKDFRASFGQRLMKKKASIREVQEKMRHSSITTTLRHYATLAPDEYDEMEQNG